MGSIAYDFLANSFFFSDSQLENGFSDVSNSKIEQELEAYRSYCIENFVDLSNDISSKTSSIKVFSNIDKVSVEFLTQTALYMEQFILSDPLFKFSYKPSETSEVSARFLGFKNTVPDKESLTKILKFLKRISPFIANDYVKIIPFSLLFEGTDDIPFNIPVDYYEKILPVPILNYFKSNAIVSSMEKHKNGGWVLKDNLDPCRAISVSFKEQGDISSMIYFLQESYIESYDKETRKVKYRMTFTDSIPDRAHFHAWIKQSINSSAKAFFDKVCIENTIASKLNSTILYNNTFTTGLLEQQCGNNETIETFSANQLINLNLPFIENIDLNKLMSIRKYEENVFTNFRIELEKNFRELRLLSDPKDIELCSENIIHELGTVQLNKINNKFSHIQKHLGLNTVVLLGSLMGTSVTGGLSLLGILLAAAKGYKTYSEYMEKVKDNPSYLLWKVLK